MFHVYASPGWEFTLAMLAALALDDLHRGLALPERRLLAIAVGCLLAALLAVVLAWPPIRQLAARLPGYWPYPVLSAVWALSTLTALCSALTSERRLGLAAMILSCNAVLLFALPLLSGTRHGHVDRGPLAHLRQHQGLGRAYSMIMLQPNYGSYFDVATLNYNAVPVPSALTGRIARDLDPQMDPTALFGDKLHDLQHPETSSVIAPVAIMRLEAMGVSDLLVPRGVDPLEEAVPVGPSGSLSPLPLSSGQQLAEAIPDGLAADATVTAVGVVVGTYLGHPHGALISPTPSTTSRSGSNSTARSWCRPASRSRIASRRQTGRCRGLLRGSSACAGGGDATTGRSPACALAGADACSQLPRRVGGRSPPAQGRPLFREPRPALPPAAGFPRSRRCRLRRAGPPDPSRTVLSGLVGVGKRPQGHTDRVRGQPARHSAEARPQRDPVPLRAAARRSGLAGIPARFVHAGLLWIGRTARVVATAPGRRP